VAGRVLCKLEMTPSDRLRDAGERSPPGTKKGSPAVVGILF
jgi:hypothetical protein